MKYSGGKDLITNIFPIPYGYAVLESCPGSGTFRRGSCNIATNDERSKNPSGTDVCLP